jgi:hypothetical protein
MAECADAGVGVGMGMGMGMDAGRVAGFRRGVRGIVRPDFGLIRGSCHRDVIDARQAPPARWQPKQQK